MNETTSMIAIGHWDQQEFNFVVKPSPGSRKTGLISFRSTPQIQDMLFVANYHVLVRFKHNRAVTFKSNATVIHQPREVQAVLDDASLQILGESYIEAGAKFLLFGSKNDNIRLATLLKFKQNGIGEIVAHCADALKPLY